MMKIILLPKTDTVILCLPKEWVGTPVICKLEPMKNSFMDNDEMEMERVVNFRIHKRKTKNK